MENHVPDLDRCKRMKEKGFPLTTLYMWTPIWGKHMIHRWYSEHGFEYPDNSYPAPIVTELVEELAKIQGGSVDIAYRLHCYEGWMWNVSLGYPSYSSTNADTLPNALADLWIWLKERERERGGGSDGRGGR